ncbi:hypothetical protein [Nonomuraea sp. NPDC052265]
MYSSEYRRDLTVTANAMHSRDDATTDQAINHRMTAEFSTP